jgi:hypothetical protein
VQNIYVCTTQKYYLALRKTSNILDSVNCTTSTQRAILYVICESDITSCTFFKATSTTFINRALLFYHLDKKKLHAFKL